MYRLRAVVNVLWLSSSPSPSGYWMLKKEELFSISTDLHSPMKRALRPVDSSMKNWATFLPTCESDGWSGRRLRKDQSRPARSDRRVRSAAQRVLSDGLRRTSCRRMEDCHRQPYGSTYSQLTHHNPTQTDNSTASGAGQELESTHNQPVPPRGIHNTRIPEYSTVPQIFWSTHGAYAISTFLRAMDGTPLRLFNPLLPSNCSGSTHLWESP